MTILQIETKKSFAATVPQIRRMLHGVDDALITLSQPLPRYSCNATWMYRLSPSFAIPALRTPRNQLSSSGPTSAEIKLSLDSSAEGILVGDKRRRGSGRGKGGARVAEDTAHRSSRSRHLSPLVPVSGGLVKHGGYFFFSKM